MRDCVWQAAVVALLVAACSVATSSSTPTTGPTSAQQAGAFDADQASEVAVATCELLRGWVNTAVGHINDASSAAFDAESPVEVREAFLEAIARVRPILESWPSSVDEALPGSSDEVAALRSDLASRSSAALEVLDEMEEGVRNWPADDSETRNARTQQAFIWFEGVLAEMKPDVGPYEGGPLGDAFLTEEACELTIRP